MGREEEKGGYCTRIEFNLISFLCCIENTYNNRVGFSRKELMIMKEDVVWVNKLLLEVKNSKKLTETPVVQMHKDYISDNINNAIKDVHERKEIFGTGLEKILRSFKEDFKNLGFID